MRSVDPAPTNREEIVVAAIDLIARQGIASTTIREVAEIAGVSPPLVIHHFASKAGLIAACDAYVRDVIEQTATEGRDSGVQAMLAVPDMRRAIDYLSRSIADGGEVGRWWFDLLFDIFVETNREMVSTGQARQLDDEEMGIVLMSAMELGMLVMRPLIEARLGQNLTAPEMLERWVRAEVDLLTHGYLADEPPLGTEP